MDFEVSIYFTDFGTDALVGSTSIRVVFNNPFKAVSQFTGEVESSAPIALAMNTDIAAQNIQHGTVITIKAKTYKVIGLQPDGEDLTILVLSKEE